MKGMGSPEDAPILVIGANGYVGGRVVNALLQAGRVVRALARRPEELASRFGPALDVYEGDASDAVALDAACAGVRVAIYLLRGAAASARDIERERQAAANFTAATSRGGLTRIVYLSELGAPDHLAGSVRVRQEIGAILRRGCARVVELRASALVGSGSLAFELVRSLVDRSPVLVAPSWMNELLDPIGVEDAVAILLAALEAPLPHGGTFEIGGSERLSLVDLARLYAEERGRRLYVIRFSRPWPSLSTLLLGQLTPLHARAVGRVRDLASSHSCLRKRGAAEAFGIRPSGMRVVLRRALESEGLGVARTTWTDARSAWREPRVADDLAPIRPRSISQGRFVTSSPELAFRAIQRLGGQRAWPCGARALALRGALDRLLGGPGTQRGRRHPDALALGDVVSGSRVAEYQPGQRLCLRSELRQPGRACLVLETAPCQGGARIVVTHEFEPAGILGRLWWLATRGLVRSFVIGMLDQLAERAADPDTAHPLTRTEFYKLERRMRAEHQAEQRADERESALVAHLPMQRR
jgi:uncharacterized protein YbjT (DUF2867 family)